MGPYETIFFPNSVFSIFIIVKSNFINQKACLINWVLQFYLYQILFSIILMVPVNFYNQKHIQLIYIIYFKFSFSEILHN